jgi:flagellar basal body P-ring formation protein FlgA
MYIDGSTRINSATSAVVGFIGWVSVFVWLLFPAATFAATNGAIAKQSIPVIKSKIEEFLLMQSTGYPGKVSVAAGAIDPNLNLAECVAPEVFLPAGSRAWGKTSVGVRCSAPVAWTIYVQANVSIKTQYVIAATPLMQGHIVTEQDVMVAEGDVAQLPPGVFTDASQVIGRTVNMSLIAGSVLRQDMLKLAPVVQQGQAVLVTSNGKGFSVSAEGTALKNASEGQIVQVKVESGQVVSGIAHTGGKVEVSFEQ